MSDERWNPHHQMPMRSERPSELLFEFVRGHDRAPMSCELRFNGESYGWEAIFYMRGELFMSHGRFPLKGAAVRWAEQERQGFEQSTSEPLDDLRISR